VFGNARGDELQDVFHEPRHAALGFEETDHVGIAARERAQRRIPVRVRQRARIEHEVRVARYTDLEPEGLDQKRKPPGAALLHALADELAQIVHAHLRGVDDQVGRVEDGFEQPPLDRHRFLQRDVIGADGVLAARFGEPPQQLVVIREQEHDFALNAALLELLDEHGNRFDLGRGIARIHSHGRARVLRVVVAQRVGDEGLQQGRRDVVHAVEPGVFEHVQCHALAGSRQPADEN
jgi:hypothetical protein